MGEELIWAQAQHVILTFTNAALEVAFIIFAMKDGLVLFLDIQTRNTVH